MPPFEFPASALPALLDLSVSGVVYYLPVHDEAGQVVDLAFAYLNPKAQQVLRLPASPTTTYLQQWPGSAGAAGWAFHHAAFLADGPRHQYASYQASGHDSYYLLAAQRVGEGLLVSFSDPDEQTRTPVEQALRESQAREQEHTRQLAAAQAEAERERSLLQALLAQAPVAIGLFQGEELSITTASEQMATFWGRTPAQVLGQPLLAAVPELQGQGFDDLLRQVLATRQPFVGTEVPARLLRGGELTTTYYNFIYQPLLDAQGAVLGVIDVAIEVTEQVAARQQIEQLNHELETRVQERTQQLAQQQALLSQILGQVPASIATLTGPEHRYTFFNDLYQQLSAHRTVLGRTVAEVFPEVVGQGFTELLDRVYATGEPYIGTDTLALLHDATTGQPEQRYVDFIYQPLFDSQHQVQGILAFIVDVTDRVLARQQADTLQAAMLAVAQRQVQEREDLYQVFEQTPVAIVLLREPNHRIEYVNPAYAQFFPGRQLRGYLLAEAHPAATASGTIARLDRVFQTGETFEGQEEPLDLFLTPGQPAQTRYFNFTYQAYREQGRIMGVSIFAYDVTAQVLARRTFTQQLEAQQQELRRILEQAPVAITILRGAEFVIELANAAISRLWGRPASRTVGRPHFEVLPETEGQGFKELMREVLTTGQPATVTEAPVFFNRGAGGQPEQVYLNFSFQPLYDEAGVTQGLIAVGVEVTGQVLARQQVLALNQELTATNAELHASNARLVRTNTDLDTFVYTASHDLKAPIANIEGLLDALRDYLPADYPEAMVPRLLGMMQGAVGRFQQTIGHLTDVSRLHHTSNEPAEAVPLAAAVEAVRLDLAPLLEATHAQLLLDLGSCPTVYFSPKNLRSILYNLLSNALKYRAPDRAPVVQVRATCSATQVALTVQDNGLGLSAQQQAKLFTLFKRLHTHVEGSGVGLYMLKRIVENAGGAIRVQSEPGVGSTFEVTLPRA